MTETALAATESDAETCTWHAGMNHVIDLVEGWLKDADLTIMSKLTAAEQVLAAIEKGVRNG